MLKTFTTYFSIWLVFNIFFFSCRKADYKDHLTFQTISIVLKVNEEFKCNLGAFGSPSDVTISQQATHFDKSLITEEIGPPVLVHFYNYKPSLNFIGDDEVEIKQIQGGYYGSDARSVLMLRIRFTITN